MAADGLIATYKDLLIFLATAGVVVPLFLRLRVSPVIGFLMAGAILGPHGIGRLDDVSPWLNWIALEDSHGNEHIAEFGIVFLLFTIGLELSWERLRALRRLVFGFGSLQVLLSALVIAALVYSALGSFVSACIAGLALALSSTAIVIPVLAEQKRLGHPVGRLSFSVLLFQDLAVAPILFAVGLLQAGESGHILISFLWTLGQAALAIALIVIIGRTALRPLFHLVATSRSPEIFMAACLLVVVTASLVTAVSGLSMALGAFLGGILLAETEYRRAIAAMIEPFKGLLLGVFFMSVGMKLDIQRLFDSPLTVLGLALALIAVKGVIVAGLASAFRLGKSVGIEAGLMLGPGGEFAFVIISSAIASKMIAPDIAGDIVLVATITMMIIPLLGRIAPKLERKQTGSLSAEPEEQEAPPSDGEARVIVVGYGRVGRLVTEMLARHKVPYVALDTDTQRVSKERAKGSEVYFGDATRYSLLHACGIEHARALVITLDKPGATETVANVARRMHPGLVIVARARDARHATQLYELGVNDAIPETIEASLQLSEAVLVDIGVPMGLVIASIHERRDEYRATLKPVISGEDDTGPEFHSRRHPLATTGTAPEN